MAAWFLGLIGMTIALIAYQHTRALRRRVDALEQRIRAAERRPPQ